MPDDAPVVRTVLLFLTLTPSLVCRHDRTASYPRPCTSTGTIGPSKFHDASLYTCHALKGPRQTLRDLAYCDPLCVGFRLINNVAICILTLARLYQISERCELPCGLWHFSVYAACVSFAPPSPTQHSIRVDGLILTRQGLAPCKKHQASLGALT